MKCTSWQRIEKHKLDKKAEGKGDDPDTETIVWKYAFVKPDGDKHTIVTNHPLDIHIGEVVTLESLARRQQQSILV